MSLEPPKDHRGVGRAHERDRKNVKVPWARKVVMFKKKSDDAPTAETGQTFHLGGSFSTWQQKTETDRRRD